MYSNTVALLLWFLSITENACSIHMQFTQPEYVFEIYENEPTGTEVGQVQANTDESEKLTYSFRYGATEFFEIDPMNGKILTRVHLDREERSEYYISVVATSEEGVVSPPADVKIHVLDLNDNAPLWLFPNYENSPNIFIPYNGSEGPIARYYSDTSYIAYNAPVGLVVTHVEAEDADAGENARLSYRFAQENFNPYGLQVDEYFSINEQTGAISVTKQPGKFCDAFSSMAVIDVMVSDNGVPALSSAAELYVMFYGCENYQSEGKML